jgi:hypothetical protein
MYHQKSGKEKGKDEAENLKKENQMEIMDKN